MSKDLRNQFRKETNNEPIRLAHQTIPSVTTDYIKWLEEQLSIHFVSESTYPEEFVHLAKGNYLDKDGSIKEAQVMKDHLGNEYFKVAKDKLYSR